jgi:hypothetical protein
VEALYRVVKLLESKSPDTGQKLLDQHDLEWFVVQAWNLAKRAEQLNSGKSAALLHKAVGVLVSAMDTTQLEYLRQGHAAFVGALRHVLLVVHQVCNACAVMAGQPMSKSRPKMNLELAYLQFTCHECPGAQCRPLPVAQA